MNDEIPILEAGRHIVVDNVNLVELTKAERWDGKLPTTMLPNSTVPFLEVNKSK